MDVNIKVRSLPPGEKLVKSHGNRRSRMFEGSERKQREHEMKEAGRLPPGQALTLKWPVLHYGSVPRFDPASWEFNVTGLVESPTKFTWEEFSRLPRMAATRDFHCGPRWSRFDNHWEGVAFREILTLARPKANASHVLVHAEQDFTANVPLPDVDRD